MPGPGKVSPVYRRIVRPVLYRMDAETAHERTLRWLSRQSVVGLLRRMYGAPSGVARTVFGVRFPGPVGLAAGMDKNGIALPAWRALGFGFAEVGTVTAYGQPGSPRPRLFRLVESQALINRMGFNNLGSQALADRLHEYGDLGFPIGISIGKSKETPLSEAVEDYAVSLRRLYRYGAYFAINVSSPNTPGLRSLQDGGQLRELLTALRAESVSLSKTFALSNEPKPLLVKIAPDLSESAIDDVLQVCADTAVAGIIATNTTIGRDGLAPADQSLASESGGLSGRPLTPRALSVVSYIHRHTDLPIIGVGGILTPDDASRMFEAGASLLQLYTGLVYTGPTLVHRINRFCLGAS